MVALRPEAKAKSGSRAAGAPGALIRRGAANLFDEKSVDAAMRIVACDAGKTCIHDHRDSIDCQGGFCHICGNDDLALGAASDSLVLVRGGELAMKRKDEIPAGNALAQIPNGALDLIGTGHENESISFGPLQILCDRLCSKFPRGLVPRGSWRRYSISTGKMRPAEESV